VNCSTGSTSRRPRRASPLPDCIAPCNLFSASEPIDDARELVAGPAAPVHGNERRLRVFHDRVAALSAEHSRRERARQDDP
jgi:hypothetical protein